MQNHPRGVGYPIVTSVIEKESTDVDLHKKRTVVDPYSLQFVLVDLAKVCATRAFDGVGSLDVSSFFAYGIVAFFSWKVLGGYPGSPLVRSTHPGRSLPGLIYTPKNSVGNHS